VLLVCYLLVLFDLTLLRFRQHGAALNLGPFESILHYLRIGGRAMMVNIFGNVAAFLPLGFLVPSFVKGRGAALRVALISLALSLLVESLQYLSGRRTADVDDLILNTLGGLLGYALLMGWRRLGGQTLSRKPRGDAAGGATDLIAASVNQEESGWVGEPWPRRIDPGELSDACSDREGPGPGRVC
jgi:hypothetical protein